MGDTMATIIGISGSLRRNSYNISASSRRRAVDAG
jgi:hypothetical protein